MNNDLVYREVHEITEPTISVKKLKEGAVLPVRGSVSAAGYDLYACLPGQDGIGICPHETAKISTGLAMAIPDGFFGAIFARSGLATKNGLRPANCVGVIDSDYRGEIIVALHNDTEDLQTVENGERVAQLVIMPYLSVKFSEVEELDETERGTGGFGSTGKTVIECDGEKWIQPSLFDVMDNQ